MKATISKDYLNTTHDFDVEYKILHDENSEVFPSIDKITYNKHDVTLAFIDEIQLLVNENPECLN